jgi:acyl dehydratase
MSTERRARISARKGASGAGSPVAGGQYLEDFAVGRTYGSGRLRVDEERIKSFAAEFDPQPFHLNVRSRTDIDPRWFGSHRLAHGGADNASPGRKRPQTRGLVGVGFDELRWPRPIRPGDELRLESEVLEVRPSKSRPQQGLIKVRTTALNQNGEAVQVLVANLMVPRRSSNMAKEVR